MFNNKDNGDVNISYSNVAVMYSKTINYLEDEDYYDYEIKAPFLYKEAMSRPLTSYLKSKRKFTKLSSNLNNMNCSQCLIIFTNVEPKSPIYEEVKDNPNYGIIKKYKEGNVWSEIYKKKTIN